MSRQTKSSPTPPRFQEREYEVVNALCILLPFTFPSIYPLFASERGCSRSEYEGGTFYDGGRKGRRVELGFLWGEGGRALVGGRGALGLIWKCVC